MRQGNFFAYVFFHLKIQSKRELNSQRYHVVKKTQKLEFLDRRFLITITVN